MSSRSEPEHVTPELLREWGLPDPGASKNSRGRLAVVGGSKTSTGAVVLAGEAALRVGAGKVGVVTASDAADSIRGMFPEAGVHEIGVHGDPPGREWIGELDAADAVLVGPGIDDPDVARARLELLAASSATCAVLDAFAVGVLREIDRGDLPASLIINMNLDEAALLLGRDVRDPIRDAVDLAGQFDAVIHCYEAIATPAGAVWQVGAGGAGLGTAGSGDVLAGAIAGFAARGMRLERAAAWGAWCHGRSGDRLTTRMGHGFLARELAAELPYAVLEAVGPEEVSDDGDDAPA
jgi:hydroxyethylthiazole kinase-like uncharacterized protein yjeF